MKTYHEAVAFEARKCYALYMDGSNDFRSKNINILSYIYNSPYVDRDIQEAFLILVENRGVE